MPLVKIEAPEAERPVQEEEQEEKSYTEMHTRELLTQALEVTEVKNNASSRIKQIKDVFVARMAPRFAEDSPTHIEEFDNLEEFAFRDPEDEDQIVVQHPDVPLVFRFKRVQSVKWQTLQEVIASELQRVRTRLEQMEEGDSEFSALSARAQALNWVLEKREEYCYNKSFGRFAAVGKREETQQESEGE